MMPSPHLHLWAKTANDPAARTGALFHPLLYHLLDVAAVAQAMLAQAQDLEALAVRLAMARDDLAAALVFCGALHDIGKSSVHFQMRVPALWPGRSAPPFGPLPEEGSFAERPHGDVTDLYLRDRSGDDHKAPAILTTAFRRSLVFKEARHEGLIVTAIAGHHGTPTLGRDIPAMTGAEARANRPFREAAQAILADLRQALALPDAPIRVACDDAGAAVLSWRLAALLPVCDWVGSNQQWFPCRASDLDTETYWRAVALPRAGRALAASGLARVCAFRPEPSRTLRHLEGRGLTPVQEHAFGCPIDRGEPSLFLIEDATGAGKTEAALVLAHRLMAEAGAQGFYVALPTMATANAMHSRLADSYRALFAEGAPPSLALAHGKAERNQRFLESLATLPARNGRGEADGGAFCSGWIADSRRKALLAHAGAGTIDQALMAVLPLRYQSLRLHGLVGKALILDEVHAFDPYMLRLIETLLELHAMLGGSAILMSATLPLATRRRLLAAFARGRGQAAPEIERSAYPLVTSWSGGSLEETALPLAAASRRRVAVRRIGSPAEAERLAVDMARRGAAVAVLRTTVDSCLESFARIRAEHEATGLFHARFLLDDRLAIERDVLARFGNKGDPEARVGRILVATQVIEQSLDIDFDVFITDLAPIDLLIQRAGRLWRHARSGRPVAEPVLHVVSPPPSDDCGADWLASDLKEAAWVYGDVARLWLTARLLFDAGAVVTATLADGEENPSHGRRLVEAVYAAGPEALPTPALAQALDRFDGKSIGEAQHARQTALEPRAGYVRSGPWESEARASTRLELRERVTVRLARRDGAALRPLGEDWSLSELRLSLTFAAGLKAATPGETQALSPPWAAADEGVWLLVLERAGDGWRSADGCFAYDSLRGLRRLQDDGDTRNSA